MTAFRTLFPITENVEKFDYQSNLLLLGSCFAENIGDKLAHFKFNTNTNPFGILYNPESIANSIEFLIKNKTFKEADIFEHQGIWNSFYHHSRFSNVQKEMCLAQINQSVKTAASHLANTNFLIITWGTAWVYEYKRTGKVVSNCHKVPNSEFSRHKLAVCDIVERYKALIKKLKNSNLNINIILTVSPVRHLKDGAEQNQLSKATLIMAAHELAALFPKVTYFPSYELVMDDLRDYRFYNADMVHPSNVAVDYIWDRFCTTYTTPQTLKHMTEVDKVKTALLHRPFQPQGEEYQKFIKNLLKKINDLEKILPTVDFANENVWLRQQISG